MQGSSQSVIQLGWNGSFDLVRVPFGRWVGVFSKHFWYGTDSKNSKTACVWSSLCFGSLIDVTFDVYQMSQEGSVKNFHRGFHLFATSVIL